MSFRLESFGTLRLLDAAGEPVFFPEKGLLTLCYLLDRPDRECPRGTLARFLWDSTDNPDIMANLRKMISRVQARQAEIGAELLIFTATGVRIRREVFVADRSELDTQSSAGPLDVLRRLVSLLQTDFLAELADQSASIREWVSSERNRHMAILVDAVKRALPEARSRADIGLIKEAALRIFRDAPDDENIRHILCKPTRPRDIWKTPGSYLRAAATIYNIRSTSALICRP